MRGIVVGLLVYFSGVVLTGCATVRPTAGLETRVQALENRVGVLEADYQSSAPRVSGASLDMESAGVSSRVDITAMTKKDIQTALKNAGYYDGEIDGKIGPKTRAAIKAFQGDKGLKEDGIPGSQTKEKLAKYLS